MNFRKFFLCTTVVLLMAGFAPLAFGLTLNLDSVIKGSDPDGTPPWLYAVITQIKTDRVSLTMYATNLTAGSDQFVSEWFFNVNVKEDSYVAIDPGSLNDIASMQYDGSSFSPDNIGNGNGPTSGFDFGFSFKTANNDNGEKRFGAGESFSVELTGAGLTEDSFLATNEGGFFSAAYVQTKGGSWIGAPQGGTQPVPEPTTMLLLGAGLIGIGFFGRKRFLK